MPETAGAALAVLDRGRQQYPDSVDLRYAIASTEEEAGRVNAALKELKDVVKLRPDDPAALNAYGYTLADHNLELGRARAYIERAYVAAPANAAILDSLGWVLYRQGHPEQALPYLVAAYADDRGADIGAHYGEVLWRLGRRTEADKVWDEAGVSIRTTACSMQRAGVYTRRRNVRQALAVLVCARCLPAARPCTGPRHRHPRSHRGISALRSSSTRRAGSWTAGRPRRSVNKGGRPVSDWRQNGPVSELHLAGPLGVGASPLPWRPRASRSMALRRAPRSTQKLQERLGFELPLDNLRFWLLGIPNPDVPFDLTRNAQDRAQHLAQAGWSIDYDQYRPAGGDVLPAHLVLSRADARVRIVVDRWLMPL